MLPRHGQGMMEADPLQAHQEISFPARTTEVMLRILAIGDLLVVPAEVDLVEVGDSVVSN